MYAQCAQTSAPSKSERLNRTSSYIDLKSLGIKDKTLEEKHSFLQKLRFFGGGLKNAYYLPSGKMGLKATETRGKGQR